MITHVANDLLNSAAASRAPPHAPFPAASMRVALFTDARLDDNVRANLFDEGFVVQIVRQALLHEPSMANIHADIVAVDRSLPGLSSLEAMAQLRFHGTNVPVVFVNGLASMMKQANYRSDVVGGGPADIARQCVEAGGNDGPLGKRHASSPHASPLRQAASSTGNQPCFVGRRGSPAHIRGVQDHRPVGVGARPVFHLPRHLRPPASRRLHRRRRAEGSLGKCAIGYQADSRQV